MSSARSANRFSRDSRGTSLLEFTLVFPVVMLAALGTLDVAYMLFDWAAANKATFVGARRAVVLDPVATEVTDLTYSTADTQMGKACSDPATGAADPTSDCPTVTTVCTPAATGGSCTNGYTWNETAFTNPPPTTPLDSPLSGIFDQMHKVFPRVQRQNVQISYQTNGLGFVGRPDGLPMNVTVSIRCMTYEFYFLGALMNWAFAAPAGCPAGTPAGLSLPSFATTLPSEDICSSDDCPK
jgi:Flp pilus assembly protein TadG